MDLVLSSDRQAGQEYRNGASLDFYESRWYAAYTSPRHEKKIADQLEKSEVECFVPMYVSVRRWKDRRKQLKLPLFPGYVFVKILLQDRLRVLRTPGVLQFVSFSGRPAVIPDREIDTLARGLAKGQCAQPHPYLKAGHRVRVNSGPLSGVEGVLIRRKDRFRLVLSIHLVQRSVAVEVDESEVEPIS